LRGHKLEIKVETSTASKVFSAAAPQKANGTPLLNRLQVVGQSK
jgi:hypothetical protein